MDEASQHTKHSVLCAAAKSIPSLDGRGKSPVHILQARLEHRSNADHNAMARKRTPKEEAELDVELEKMKEDFIMNVKGGWGPGITDTKKLFGNPITEEEKVAFAVCVGGKKAQRPAPYSKPSKPAEEPVAKSSAEWGSQLRPGPKIA